MRLLFKYTIGLIGVFVRLVVLHPFNGLFFRTTWVSRYRKGKTSVDLNEATDDGVSAGLLGFRDGSGISWTTCKQSAPAPDR